MFKEARNPEALLLIACAETMTTTIMPPLLEQLSNQ
jgi:hypothetical protein